MADAVVGDKGDVVYSETGQNLTGYNILRFYITKPDGSGVTKNIADGVNIGKDGVIDASYFQSRRNYADFAAGGFRFDDLCAHILRVTYVLTPTVILRREWCV